MKKRVFLIVLDSLGAGEAPDAADFGDKGANTLRSLSRCDRLAIPNLRRLGLANIEGLDFLGEVEAPAAAHSRLCERSMGKDTTIGHWEIAGVVSNEPLPTYPNGFPSEIIEEFERLCGRGVLCNKPYSGTEVLKDYGDEHLKTGKLIVYTSADSVFQIAAHEDIVPPEELYGYCRMARSILVGKHGVGRVIARPFVTENGSYRRTSNRRDFSLEVPVPSLLDDVKAAGLDMIAVGKINDIFAGRGTTDVIITHGNTEGIEKTVGLCRKDFHGLCFVNLVDFDMLYGHRNDIEGYALALNEFDDALPRILSGLGADDLLIITADHGCDPGDVSTDHTREYVPLLVYGEGIKPVDLGTRVGFCDIASTIAEFLGIESHSQGISFKGEITDA